MKIIKVGDPIPKTEDVEEPILHRCYNPEIKEVQEDIKKAIVEAGSDPQRLMEVSHFARKKIRNISDRIGNLDDEIASWEFEFLNFGDLIEEKVEENDLDWDFAVEAYSLTLTPAYPFGLACDSRCAQS